ncbi:tRNA delta(2)-isopentenylpyrophosphate transferase [Lacticaseibacillus camelliae DSM 22697 = JCM 13995]|uniref:tRNA dimethylallyltransferase n=1 Tax=Lacticaseibacillus camelliae DSM 22697 = JCM 13995 TaxID=1423730 RepID=A0A0R2F971_9LACO|nr:tRNA delta(2)-isopentenylpyrophosphate transferase [Lacticaseibacillus camelliae DSM 22697 = JCM 13995]
MLMIGGPTATGKSALGVQLARQFNGEVINGDAFQIYRGMDIGTAKVTPAEMAGIPHHLIDIKDPGESFSAAQFQRLAESAIKDLTRRGKLPIVVGGTGFYLNALRLALPLGEHAASPVRTKWQQALAEHGPDWLWGQLGAQDPEAASRIPVGNSRRVIRALEVIETTGRKFSAQAVPVPVYDTLVLGLTTDRPALYARIDQRVDQMVESGLEAEVRRVLQNTAPSAQALKAIGYKEWLPYFAGQATLAETVGLIKKNSRHYAKRQLTYFRHQLPTHWLDMIADPEGGLAQAQALVANWLD